jgi:protein involved in ribonucleotide reduction
MKKCLFAIALLVISCATTRIMPHADGSYIMVANSASEGYAYDAAIKDAEKFCEKKGKKFAVLSQDSRYQGMDKNAKAIIGVIGAVNPNNQNNYSNSTSSQDDYKVEIKFQCK